VEGPTDDQAIVELRARQQRTFIATPADQPGLVAMLLHGDELAAPSRATTTSTAGQRAVWMDWELRTGTPGWSASPPGWPLSGRPPDLPPAPVLSAARWSRRGRQATSSTTSPGSPRPVRRYRGGTGSSGFRPVRRGLPQRRRHPDVDERGDRVLDDSFLLCFNASVRRHPGDPARAQLRRVLGGRGGHREGRGVTLADAQGWSRPPRRPQIGRGTLNVPSRSLLVLQRTE